VSSLAGASVLGELASSGSLFAEEAAIVSELKAGSEDAFAWLIAHYSQPVHSLVYRMLDDPSDAADTTQEVFIKIFRGIRGFNSNSSLKTWIYRIALHEASNQRRWWFRHRGRETPIEPADGREAEGGTISLLELLSDSGKSPLDSACDAEFRDRVEAELRSVAEPYRTTLILRDIEELSYEEIAEVLGVTLGTVKSRLMRGREALRKKLERHLAAFGVQVNSAVGRRDHSKCLIEGQNLEVMP
jgi:RNA polymerase sigma-70 factor, ECF subfamily